MLKVRSNFKIVTKIKGKTSYFPNQDDKYALNDIKSLCLFG